MKSKLVGKEDIISEPDLLKVCEGEVHHTSRGIFLLFSELLSVIYTLVLKKASSGDER